VGVVNLVLAREAEMRISAMPSLSVE
jgi:hypothetical protein